MAQQKEWIKVALIGNPNTGKTSVFNNLTGLNQQVGNYPGITVEKKQGFCKLSNTFVASILDLPGTYSLNASSLDENVVIEVLLNKNDADFPDVAVVVTDVENIKRNLLLFTQIKDLEIPTLLVINMADRMAAKGISIDLPLLESWLQTQIILVSARKGTGFEALKNAILDYKKLSTTPCLNASSIDEIYFNNLRKAFPNQLLYKLWLVITQDVNFGKLNRKTLQETSFTKSSVELKKLQHKETIKRYQFINDVLKKTYHVSAENATDFRMKIDRILTHKIGGFVVFFILLNVIFQSIFNWSSIPMDFIDGAFATLSNWLKTHLPAGSLTNLLAEGIVPGLGGICIFIPQIVFLFLFIAVLEESGYMSRVVFLMDKLMRRFGLSGKSVVPLVSGTACAIPAIMATRNIENWKERLITILVTPFITCSARLPVYAILIALIIPDTTFWGVNLQGITLMILYLLGFGMALLSASILQKTIQSHHKSYFVVEMPNYKIPLFKNVALTVLEKTKSFVFGAGKTILIFSVIIWFLGSYGPNDWNGKATNTTNRNLSEEALATQKLENSYMGWFGKKIEPIIQPIGYDWKIGIAVASSFVAREVFVGTLATLYKVGAAEEDTSTIKERMAQETRPNSPVKVFNFATGISLLLFYAFAMQCISTLAIVKKETNSWKWPIIQLLFMSGLAYGASFLAYQFLK